MPTTGTAKALSSLAAIIFILFGAQASLACECATSQTCSQVEMHDSMFLGKAINVSIVEAKTEHEWRHRVFRFVVIESFKGTERIGDQVDIATGMGGGDCGYGFAIGERYLVDAFKSNDQLRTGICGVTAPEKRALVSMRELRLISSGGRVPDLSGRVAIDSNRAFPVSGASRSLPGIPINAKALRTGVIHRAITDTEGVYTFQELTPGEYELSPELPITLTTDTSGLATLGPPLTITVPASGRIGAACRLAVNVHPTGRISGTVVDSSGQAVKGYIFAYPTPGEEPLELYQWASSAQIGKDGHFKLGGLRAGGYKLMFESYPTAANVGSTRKPLERRYYPDASTSNEATTVRVEDDGTSAVISFVLKF
jgi:hypothetical protein